MSLALITGASAGIGADLAREHASRGGDVVLVARRVDRLESLAGELRSMGVEAHVHALDLSDPGAAAAMMAWLDKQGLVVDVLINNAGFGLKESFVDADLGRDLEMIRLNVETLVALTRLVLPGMVERGEGRILNVGSTAGFLPGPGMAVYYATKAFVNSFSQAVAAEVRGSGVSVTVLCPGPVKTEFDGVAGIERSRMFERAISSQKTARIGYKAMERGRLVQVVPGSFRALRLVPLLPRRSILRASGSVIKDR